MHGRPTSKLAGWEMYKGDVSLKCAGGGTFQLKCTEGEDVSAELYRRGVGRPKCGLTCMQCILLDSQFKTDS